VALAVNSDDSLHDPAKPTGLQSPVGQWRHQAPGLPNQVCLREKAVTEAYAALGGIMLLPGNHQAGKIDLILMGGRVGAVVVAQLAVIALVGDTVEIGPGQFLHVAFVGIDSVKQRIERRAQVEATAASVANVVDSKSLFFDLSPGYPGGDEIKPLHSNLVTTAVE
jgi:hypothetical protein